MPRERMSFHGGFGSDPATKVVSPPIHQNMTHEFDSADHIAALFDLEESGFHFSRIANPTVKILEKRVAMLEGGIGALCLVSGQATLCYALLALAIMAAQSRLYETSHTLLAYMLRRHGVKVRFAATDHARDIAARMEEAFWQGRPDYEADTLAPEARRDMKRFARGRRRRAPSFAGELFRSGGEGAARTLRRPSGTRRQPGGGNAGRAVSLRRPPIGRRALRADVRVSRRFGPTQGHSVRHTDRASMPGASGA
jgi:hypothetical protein